MAPAPDYIEEYLPPESELDGLVAKAVEAAAQGENIEQLLETMLQLVPVAMREKLRQKFASALGKRGLRAPSKNEEIVSRGALLRIRNLFIINSLQMLERIRELVRSRPDIAAAVMDAGATLNAQGVRVETSPLSEAELGVMSPGTSMGVGVQRGGSGRGV